jgi:hypothetical protein
MLPTPNPSVIYRSLPDGAVLFDAGEEVYFGLNVVAAQVWELLPGHYESIETLCAALARSYPDVPPAALRGDVEELLASLLSFGLLLPTSAIAATHATLRERPVQAARA